MTAADAQVDAPSIVRTVFDRVRAHDYRVADLYAEDALITLPDRRIAGRPAIGRFYREVFSSVGPQPQLRGLWENGTELVALLEVTMPTGTIHTIDVFDVVAGLITRMTLYLGGLGTGRPPRPPAQDSNADPVTAHRAVFQLGETRRALGQTPFEVLTDTVLLDGIWQRPGLAVRDRRLATMGVLAARGGDERRLLSHVRAAVELNELSATELRELAAHLAFYGGWPAGSAASEAVEAVLSEST